MTTAFDKQAQAYIDASGSSAAVRSVKSQIYGAGKQLASVAERTASASALPERIGAEAVSARIVTQRSHVRAPVDGTLNNMGVYLEDAEFHELEKGWVSVCDEDFGEVKLFITDTGESKTELVRLPSSTQACMNDWTNCNVHEDTFFKTAGRPLITDDEIVEEASRQFQLIWGFGATEKRAVGLNFYRESWVLGDGMGFICFGGQRSTLMVVLNGQGCHSALPGWEKRLYDFLTKVAVRPVLTRVDLAHDDFEGAYLSVDWADQKWSEGGFSFKKSGGRPCDIRHLGNWKRPTGKGRTLTLGMRSSSKFCRFYERGMMLGDKESRWCRCEIELKSTTMIIPFDILLDPTGYFKGAYPCIAEFAHVGTPKRIAVKAKSAQISVDTAIAITKRQYGKYIRVFRSLFDTEQQLLDAISHPDEGVWPKRLRPYLVDATSGPAPIHEQPKLQVPDFVPFPSTVPSSGVAQLDRLADIVLAEIAIREAMEKSVSVSITVPSYGLSGESGFVGHLNQESKT